jgi:hypothetical protein
LDPDLKAFKKFKNNPKFLWAAFKHYRYLNPKMLVKWPRHQILEEVSSTPILGEV